MQLAAVTFTPATSNPSGGGGSAELLAYAEWTTDVTIASTSEATPTTVVTAPALELDGTTPVLVSCYCPSWETPSPGDNGHMVALWDALDGADAAAVTDLGLVRVVGISGDQAATLQAVYFARRLTPAAGSHVYSVRAWVANGTATTGVAHAGDGTAGAFVPGYVAVMAAPLQAAA